MVNLPWSPFSLGPPKNFWERCQKLVINVAYQIYPSSTNFPNLFGMTESNIPSPYYVTDNGARIEVQFVTNDNTLRYFRYTYPTGDVYNLKRFTFQIDLTQAQVTTYYNKLQVVPDTGGLNTGFGKGLYFRPNVYSMCKLGGISNGANFGEFFGGPNDTAFHGFYMHDEMMWQNLGAGSGQALISGVAATDSNTYFNFSVNGRRPCGFMNFTETPGDTKFASYYCRAFPGGGETLGLGYGLCLHRAEIHPYNGSTQIRMEDLTIHNSYGSFGAAVAMANTLNNMTFSRVTANGGAVGFGNILGAVCYVVTLDNCFAHGDEASYFGYSQIANIKGLTCDTVGRTALRLFASTMNCKDLLTTTQKTWNEYYVDINRYGDNGGVYNFENCIFDSEGGGEPSKAAFRCQTHRNIGPTHLTLTDCVIGTIGASGYTVRLEGDYALGSYPSKFTMKTTTQQNSFHSGMVWVNDSYWHGEIEDTYLLYNNNYPHIVYPDGSGNVIEHIKGLTALPTGGIFTTNGHRITMSQPASGGVLEYRCVRGGTYGTATPPLWMAVSRMSGQIY
jgi:hypothetical protein